MPSSCEVRVRFYPPSAELRRYFTTFYNVEWIAPEGRIISDHLLPEWANLRFHLGNCPVAETRAGVVLSGSPFAATGPSSQPVHFSLGSARLWGVGLLPLGWAKFVGAPASDFANALLDGNSHPQFAQFRDLAGSIFREQPDPEGEWQRIDSYFLACGAEPVPDEDRIVAIHTALIDSEVSTVSQLVERSGASQRTAERICRRAFGFPPKLLLRRQRFMRSLAQFVVDPSLKWIDAIDGHYHDQAQFVRDFRQFMGMTPRQYAALPKPLLGAIMRERARLAGSAVQTLDSPNGTSLLG